MSFKIEDFKKGIFSLQDNLYQVRRKWKIHDKAKTGLAMLMNSLDKESDDLPNNKEELEQKLQDMSPQERAEFMGKMNRQSHKQLAILSSLSEPLDEIPEILDNKMEFLAACIDENDAAKIYAFFLIKSNGSIISQGDSQQTFQTMVEMMDRNRERSANSKTTSENSEK